MITIKYDCNFAKKKKKKLKNIVVISILVGKSKKIKINCLKFWLNRTPNQIRPVI